MGSIQILFSIGHDFTLTVVVHAVDQFTDVSGDLLGCEALVGGQRLPVHQCSQHLGFNGTQRDGEGPDRGVGPFGQNRSGERVERALARIAPMVN